ncbi:hypothetical protein BLD25_04935 [Candidatus Gracilibacteria bacterium GN02-872]|jgi:lipoprotein|nr:hypothetical protein BLD25_04935 [Candidatus Gracilibacteria bacterium GN02-872]
MKTKYLSLTVSLMFFPYAHGVQGCGIHSPNGYVKDFEKNNVCAFRKVNSRTRVFVANLKSGARVNFSVEKVGNSKERLKNGKYDFFYKRKYINDFMGGNKVVINGQFFSMDNSAKAFLSFPIKYYGNNVISEGPDMRLNGGGRTEWDFRTLIFYENYRFSMANVKPYKVSDINLRKKLIVGLRPDYNGPEVRANSSIGRTYVGVRNTNYTSPSSFQKEIILFAVSDSATTGQMINLLNDWNVSKENMIMFDGSASSQYKFSNTSLDFSRRIPMVFTIN